MLFRSTIANQVQNTTPYLAKFQSFCGVSIRQKCTDIQSVCKYEVENLFLFYIFHLGASLGNEVFYLLFLPGMFWNYDPLIARAVIELWVCIYYIGHFVKDVYQLPRPTCSSIARMESHYSMEYGFPSTHAMAAFSIPWLLYLTAEESFQLKWIPIACLWTLTMSFSRLYLGVHSIPDVVYGALMGSLILFFFARYASLFDEWILIQPMCPVYTMSLGVLLVLLYPAPKKWTNAYGDTTLIVATGVGVLIGEWLRFQQTNEPFFKPSMITSHPILALSMSALGYSILFFVRTTTKWGMLKALGFVFGHIPPADRSYRYEIPTKFVCYGLIGLFSTYILPCIYFKLLQLGESNL